MKVCLSEFFLAVTSVPLIRALGLEGQGGSAALASSGHPSQDVCPHEHGRPSLEHGTQGPVPLPSDEKLQVALKILFEKAFSEGRGGDAPSESEALLSLAAFLEAKAAELSPNQKKKRSRRLPEEASSVSWSVFRIVIISMTSVFALFAVALAIFKVYWNSFSEGQDDWIDSLPSNAATEKASFRSAASCQSSAISSEVQEDQRRFLIGELKDCHRLLGELRRRAKETDAVSQRIDSLERIDSATANIHVYSSETNGILRGKQDALEQRCDFLFERLRLSTEKKSQEEEEEEEGGFSSGSSGLCSVASVSPSSVAATDEYRASLLTQLEELFEELDAAFAFSRPAHVSAMIKCCNALLRRDGLSALKTCSDRPALHDSAQRIIERVVPCIWAS